jgi:prepilin-type N-terminal cleavage/methylation domain-containing protein
MKKNLTNTGFTLIELLVVIAIIGILASVVLSSLSDARDTAQQASAIQSAKQVIVQAEIYRNSTDPNNPNLAPLRLGWVRKYNSFNENCADQIVGRTTLNPFVQEFLRLCEGIEKLVPRPTNAAYMFWGLRERTGNVEWKGSHWSNREFSITILLEPGRYFCTNTRGVSKEGISWADAVIGCRDITN